jgi:hypothetical protein
MNRGRFIHLALLGIGADAQKIVMLAATSARLEQERKAMRKLIGFVLAAVLAMAGGCSDHHPDVWFDAGSDAKAGDAGVSSDAYQTSAGDTAADDAAVRDTGSDDGVVALDAKADMPVTPDVAGDVAVDSSYAADTYADDAQRGDSL